VLAFTRIARIIQFMGCTLLPYRASVQQGLEQKMTKYTQSQRQAILSAVRDSGPGAGATEKIRIRMDGTVEAYGRMPNTNEYGWWFAGLVDDYLPAKINA
jgi:hypothetical protein